MEFVLLAGLATGIILLLRKREVDARARDLSSDPLAPGAPAGIQGGTGISPYQAAQVQRFAAIATIAGTATSIGVAGLSSLTLASAGPIGAAVAAVIIAFGALRGTAHFVANEWVSKVQNPFHVALAAIVDGKDAALADGSATRVMVANAKKGVEQLWSQYRQHAEVFAMNGADYRKVIDQSYGTLGPLVAQITLDMSRQIASLPV